jgi:predicted proteasome-type protease
MRLFRIYAEGNFIEAGTDTPFLQTGEAKYGKPILDLAVTPDATLEDVTKCVLVSFDSTMLSNLSVGMPIDLLCYARDSLCRVTMKRRFDAGDPYFEALKQQWVAGTRRCSTNCRPWPGRAQSVRDKPKTAASESISTVRTVRQGSPPAAKKRWLTSSSMPT